MLTGAKWMLQGLLILSLTGVTVANFVQQDRRSGGRSPISAALAASDNGNGNDGNGNSCNGNRQNQNRRERRECSQKNHESRQDGNRNGNRGRGGGAHDNGNDSNSQPTPRPTVLPVAQSIPPGATCFFQLGFLFLHQNLGGVDGNCTENEHPDPNGTGDSVQATRSGLASGLMVWQRSTNTMRWTDGSRTFTYSKCGLQQRPNSQTFRWEADPSLLDGGPPPGACGVG